LKNKYIKDIAFLNLKDIIALQIVTRLGIPAKRE